MNTTEQGMFQYPQQSPIQRQVDVPYPRVRIAPIPDNAVGLHMREKAQVFDTASRFLETIAGIAGYYASESILKNKPDLYLQTSFAPIRSMLDGLNYLAELAEIRFQGHPGGLLGVMTTYKRMLRH